MDGLILSNKPIVSLSFNHLNWKIEVKKTTIQNGTKVEQIDQ
jgi:hypothetical protein